MVDFCTTWSLPGDRPRSALCSMELLQETARIMRDACPVCVFPSGRFANCANCVLPPPTIYNCSITIVPTALITYYRWLPEYADMGLVESPPGWAAVLINDGAIINPGNCGYSTSYNLFEVSSCTYDSNELETVISSLGIAPGTFNVSPTYEINCNSGTVTNPNYSGRKRVRLSIESLSGHIVYRLKVRYVVERRDPLFVLNPVSLHEIEYLGHASDDDCFRPVSFTRTGPPPSTVGPTWKAVIWSMSFLPGAR